MGTKAKAKPAARVVFVTGPSGAGRTTAINALEDAGFMAIDNMPLTLVPHLFDNAALSEPLVLGIDPRNRDFSEAQFIETIDTLTQGADMAVEVLYLQCAVDVLLKRFSATRRKHPMAAASSPLAGIQGEVDLLRPILVRADVLIDTSDLSPHQLKAEVERWYAPHPNNRMAITVQSFSYKRGIPRGVDMVFDCRFLRNPYWQEDLRGCDGTDPAVQAYVAQDDRFAAFARQVRDLTDLVIPAHVEEGRTHLSIAFGCSGGWHRSVDNGRNFAQGVVIGRLACHPASS